MKAFGCTEENDLVLENLSVDEIIESDIDPWCLDLFDGNAVSHARSGLRFTRMRNVCFGFGSGGKYYIGLCDEEGAHTFEFPECRVESGTKFVLGSASECNRDYTSLLTEYLHLYEAANFPDAQCTRDYSRSAELIQPRKSNALILHGSEFFLQRHQDIFHDKAKGLNHAPVFLGEMFAEVPVGSVNAPEIRWVFEYLGDSRPIVTGSALRHAVMDSRVDFVEILVPHHDPWRAPPNVASDLAKLGLKLEGAHSVQNHKSCYIFGTFTHNGCRYLVRESEGNPTEQFRAEGCWSADCLYAHGPDHVYASRIAAFDLGRMRARKLSSIWDKEFSLWKARRQELERNRLTLLTPPNPNSVR
jgi:hypothetical protein